jgi:nucleoside-diphosphate-sugar epimerase
MIRILITGGSGFIGTNLVDAILERRNPVLNLDINPPKKESHRMYWQPCDILDLERTLKCFQEFQPTHVVHFAARTDTLSDHLEDYRVNTEGTENVLNCVKAVQSIERLIVTSSQFVCAPPGLPHNDEEYNPIGAYGQSKVISEKATRLAGLTCSWTIIRPTNIWGPWHPRYPKEFWLVLKRGLYFHPGGKPAFRSYGYVKNVVFQILKILDAPAFMVDKKIFYTGDPPIPLTEWTNGFAMAITGRPVRIIPRAIIKCLAVAGTLLAKFRISFPITLSRYRSMTEDYLSPVITTIQTFGPSPYTLEEGIKETVDWLTHYWQQHSTES